MNGNIHIISEGIRTIAAGGASEALKQDFLAVTAHNTTSSGVPSYSSSIEKKLAHLIVGLGGKNKDTPLFELCHWCYLLNLIENRSLHLTDRMTFILGFENRSSGAYRDLFTNFSANRSLTQNIVRKDLGFEIKYPDGKFNLTYNRMPFLACLYEFLTSMDNFSFCTEFNDLLDTLFTSSQSNQIISIKHVQLVSNKISSNLRKYRQKNLSLSFHNEKYRKIMQFIRKTNPVKQIYVTDDLVLDFWKSDYYTNEFKSFKKVFEGFKDVCEDLDEIKTSSTIEHSEKIGLDFLNNEYEILDQNTSRNINLSTTEIENSISDNTPYNEDWVSPFNIINDQPSAKIKFFKYKTEQAPIELLMNYGPFALALPRSFLRVVTFSPIQNLISGILRNSRKNSNEIQNQVDCDQAYSYADKRSQFLVILNHIHKLELATFYVLNRNKKNTSSYKNPINQRNTEIDNHNDNQRELNEDDIVKQLQNARQRFNSIERVGFSQKFLDENGTTGFELALIAILKISNLLEKFLKVISIKSGTPVIDQDLDDIFQTDKVLFAKRFKEIYTKYLSEPHND